MIFWAKIIRSDILSLTITYEHFHLQIPISSWQFAEAPRVKVKAPYIKHLKQALKSRVKCSYFLLTLLLLMKSLEEASVWSKKTLIFSYVPPGTNTIHWKVYSEKIYSSVGNKEDRLNVMINVLANQQGYDTLDLELSFHWSETWLLK